LLRRRLLVLEDWGGDEQAAYGDLESIYIQLDGADHDLAKSYSPYIRDITSVHINAHAAIKAFVNWLAQSLIKGAQLDEFERVHLLGKCMFFPRLKGLKPLEAGREPLQSIKKLIQRRNVLMHYKPTKERWSGASASRVVGKLELSRQDAEASVSSARMYIEHLCEIMDLETPLWLHHELHNHFDVVFDWEDQSDAKR
jgi:hypothetical protein